MMVYVLFSRGFAIAFEDAELAQRVSSLFAANCSCSDFNGDVALRVYGERGCYGIRFEDRAQGLAQDIVASNVIGFIDDEFNCRLRATIPPGCCSVHASALSLGDSAVVLVGESGSGKTTLCLAAAASGAKLLGDEFGIINFNIKSYVQANYPFCLKEGSRAALKTFGNVLPQGELMVSPWGVCSEMLPVSAVDSVLKSMGGLGIGSTSVFSCGDLTAPLPLKAIVSLKRDRGFNSIETLNVAMWLSEIMPSLDCSWSRVRLFKQLVKLASEGVAMKQVSYVSPYDGAGLLIEEFGR